MDTRLLTEDGRKQIKEDMERTKRLGQAIGDVAIKELVSITDSFNHIDDVQKDLDVQKQVAINDNGKIIDTLENQSKYSVEQVDKALNDYAQIYADVYGVNIQTVKTALLGKYGSTYTNKDNTNSNVSLDKILNQNAFQTANTLGHEVAHVRQNQGQTYLRETTELQEEYSDIFGKYSSSGLDFSSNTYNNVQLSTIPTLNLNLTNQDVNTLKTNINLYLQDLSKANSGDGRIDDESYWTIQDMDRTKDLQFNNTKSSTLQNKLNNRSDKIDNQIKNATILTVTPIITKPILSNDIEEKIKTNIEEIENNGDN